MFQDKNFTKFEHNYCMKPYSNLPQKGRLSVNTQCEDLDDAFLFFTFSFLANYFEALTCKSPYLI